MTIGAATAASSVAIPHINEQDTPQRLRAVVLAVLAGAIFVLFNFNGWIRHMASTALLPGTRLRESLISLSLLPKQMLDTSGERLYFWMTASFIGLWLYLAGTVLLALVRRRGSIATSGMGGVVGGALAPAALCWTALLLYQVARVIRAVAGFIGYVFTIVVMFIAKILVFLLPVLAIVALAAVLVWAWKRYGVKVAVPAVAAFLLYLCMPFVRAFFEKLRLFLTWLGALLAGLFGWFAVVLVWVVKALLILTGITTVVGILGCLGHLIIEQIRSSLDAGASRKGVFTASFSIGVSMALIFLVAAGTPDAVAVPLNARSATPSQQRLDSDTRPAASAVTQKQRRKTNKKKRSRKKSRKTAAAVQPPVVTPVAAPPPPPIGETIDRAWRESSGLLRNVAPRQVFMATLPGAVQDWAARTFRNAGAPVVDAAFLAVVLALSFFGLIKGLFSRGEWPYQVRFYNKDLLLLAAIPIGVVIAVLSGARQNQE